MTETPSTKEEALCKLAGNLSPLALRTYIANAIYTGTEIPTAPEAEDYPDTAHMEPALSYDDRTGKIILTVKGCVEFSATLDELGLKTEEDQANGKLNVIKV